MLDLCYRASDAAQEIIRAQEKLASPPASLKQMVALHATLAQFTNEVQHVWDEYVELLDLISESRPSIERLNLESDWMVRSMLDQHEYIIRTWDREGDA